MKQRGFSLYDIEEFLRDAGAEKINESAVTCLERELEDTIKELVGEARVYANYAGRRAMIKRSDMDLVGGRKRGGSTVMYSALKARRPRRKIARRPVQRPTVDLITAKL